MTMIPSRRDRTTKPETIRDKVERLRLLGKDFRVCRIIEMLSGDDLIDRAAAMRALDEVDALTATCRVTRAAMQTNDQRRRQRLLDGLAVVRNRRGRGGTVPSIGKPSTSLVVRY